jgi:multiple sugar transport system substrate-binding protein
MSEQPYSTKQQTITRRELLRWSGFVSAGVLLAACAPAAAPAAAPGGGEAAAPAQAQTTVKFTTSYDIAIYDPLVPDLMKEQHPEINLVMETTPIGDGWAAYANAIMTKIAGGQVFDVIYAPTECLGNFASKNIIQDMNPLLEADSEAKQDLETEIHPTLIKATQYAGKQVGMPNGWNNMIIHYNTKLFEDKGVPLPTENWTWEEFTEASLALANVTGSADDVYAYSFWDSSFGMSPWYFNNDTAVLTPDWADSNLKDPKVAETLQFLADMILKHKVAPNPAGWDEQGQFGSRHLAMRSCGGWCINPTLADEMFDFAFQYYPHKSGDLKTVIGVGAYTMATATEVPQPAWDVIKILNGPEVQTSWATVDGAPPSRKSVADSPAFMELAKPSNADMRIFWESLDHAALVTSPINFNIVDPLLQRWYAKIWNGEMSVEEAVAGADVELQAEMDKLKS